MIELTTIDQLNEIGVRKARKLLEQWSIVEELEAWIKTVTEKQIPWRTEHDWNSSRTTCRFHPSSLSQNCDFRLFLQLLGGEEAKKCSPKKQAVYDLGTVSGLMMEYYHGTQALYHNWEYDSEVKLWKGSPAADELMLCGSADGVCTRVITLPGGLKIKVRFIWEYKTSNDNGFGGLGNRPASAYVKQVHAYMLSGNIPFAVVLYTNKDNSNFRAFLVFYSDTVWKPIRERLLRIIKIADEVTSEPLKTITRSCFMCPFFSTDCKPEGMYTARQRRRTLVPSFQESSQ